MTASGAKDIFLDALERSPAERHEFLGDACGDDAALREQVERLLAAHEDAEAGDLLAEPTAESWASDPGRYAADPIGLGTFVGPYQIVEPLGEGGYGTVYLAQQETPVKRRVAVKILKLGLDLGHVIARFELERQALALMEHPGIARIIDAGTTEQGRPYFVMEYVDGHPITRYCDEQRLSIRERLELFERVCQAIRHAHQKGIVHRDLKPTNVLVASVDGEHLPKVIDFGIAKVVSEAPAIGRDITIAHGLIGTPQYMSPEQAAGSPDLDTRTDIYSLGVVLYELLTGATPYDLDALKGAGIGGIFRYISENEPPRPSQRLGSGKTTVEVAAEARD